MSTPVSIFSTCDTVGHEPLEILEKLGMAGSGWQWLALAGKWLAIPYKLTAHSNYPEKLEGSTVNHLLTVGGPAGNTWGVMQAY